MVGGCRACLPACVYPTSRSRPLLLRNTCFPASLCSTTVSLTLAPVRTELWSAPRPPPLPRPLPARHGRSCCLALVPPPPPVLFAIPPWAYALIYTVPATFVGVYYAAPPGWSSVSTWSVVLLTFVLFPIVDAVVGTRWGEALPPATAPVRRRGRSSRPAATAATVAAGTAVASAGAPAAGAAPATSTGASPAERHRGLGRSPPSFSAPGAPVDTPAGVALMDEKNDDEDAKVAAALATLRSTRGYRLPLYAWLPVQAAVTAWAVVALPRASPPLSVTGLTGAAASLGVIGAAGITVAHELLHSPVAAERSLAGALLVAVAYGHFSVAHVAGHHKAVATADDAATAAAGESLYAFWLRSLTGGVATAWAADSGRSRPLIVRRAAATAGVAAAAAAAGGRTGLALWAVGAAMAVALLETSNYVEHYGLRREAKTGGGPGPITADHAWDAPPTLSSVLLFKLQAHADHHLHPGEPYQVLGRGGPRLPAGYPAMTLLAAVPPAWRAVMDPRLPKGGAE